MYVDFKRSKNVVSDEKFISAVHIKHSQNSKVSGNHYTY